jgi:hypothetical protein
MFHARKIPLDNSNLFMYIYFIYPVHDRMFQGGNDEYSFDGVRSRFPSILYYLHAAFADRFLPGSNNRIYTLQDWAIE